MNHSPNSTTARGNISHPLHAARAFTLIELMMVVSIIALLIAMILPALSQAKIQAHQTACGATLKGMGTALQTLIASNDNSVPWNGIVMPKPGGSNTNPTVGYGNGETNMNHWDLPYGALWPFMGQSAKAYMCPDDDRLRDGYNQVGTLQKPLQRDPKLPFDTNQTTAVTLGPGPFGYWSYSVNTVLNSEGRFRENFYPRDPTANTQQPWIDPLKWTSVLSPADFYVLIEEDTNSPFNDEVFDAPAYNGGDKLTNRHQNKGNVGYGDGHVDILSSVVFNGGISPGTGPTADHWAAMQYPTTRGFFPDQGGFATPP